MLAMLTDLHDTVFATGPRNRCLRTPGSFSGWQCQSVIIKVRVISFPTIYLITLFRLEAIFVKEVLVPNANGISMLNVCPLTLVRLTS